MKTTQDILPSKTSVILGAARKEKVIRGLLIFTKSKSGFRKLYEISIRCQIICILQSAKEKKIFLAF